MLEDRRAVESYLSESTGKPVEAIVPMSSVVIYEGLKNGSIDVATHLGTIREALEISRTMQFQQ